MNLAFNPSFFYLIPTPSLMGILWVGFGVLLIVTEFLLPRTIPQSYKFISLTMGISALLVGFNNFRYGNWPGNIQFMYWMLLSFILVIWVRPMLLKRKKYKVHEASQAKTLTTILPGEIGRVLYEGVSWPAYCENCVEPISAQRKVYVLRREGNTLIIVSEDFLL